MESMSARLKLIRNNHNLNQTEFAESLGVGIRTISRYETGIGIPKRNIIGRICAKFGVSQKWLLLGEGPMRLEDESVQTIGVTGTITKTAEKYLMESIYPQLVAEGKAPPICQNCVELYQKLVQVQERENALLKENAELKARLSLSHRTRHHRASKYGMIVWQKSYLLHKKNKNPPA